jgi:competence protein ComEC
MKPVPLAIFVVVYYLLRTLALLAQRDKFSISFLAVGQGDAFVVDIPNYGHIMIDAGPDYQSNYLSARKSALPVCTIKGIFITHYDGDHSGGLERVRRFCPDITIYDNLKRGDVISFDSVKLYILSPPDRNPARDINDNSLVMLLKYDDLEVLMTGDAGLSMLQAVSSSVGYYVGVGLITDGLDVYKVSHHGSRYNSSKSLFETLRPKNCIISVGRNNYGHPSKAVINELAGLGCTVYRTDKDGSITFTGR